MKNVFSAAAVLVIMGQVSSQSSALAEAATKPVASIPAVSVIQSTRREIVETMVVTGTLVPRDEILVTPEIDGYRITDVLVEEGARVERGQVLARLSHDLIDRQIAQQKAKIDKASAAVPQAENNIEQAEAAETEARLGFERANQLMQSGNTTAVTIEGAHVGAAAGRGADGVRSQRSRQRQSRSGASQGGR